MLQKGPVAVTLGLDPEFFQYYQSDRQNGPYFDTAFWRPSVYGVVVEYNQYEEEGKEGYSEWPYFAIETRLRACDSMIFRLPIRSTLSDANIAGIAGFAIRPLVMETVSTSFSCNENVYPTIESIPSYATELVFEENSYSYIHSLDLSRFTNLQRVTIKNGAFADGYSLIIDNPVLTTITIGTNCFTGEIPVGITRRLSSIPAVFIILNAPMLSNLSIGSGSLSSIHSIEISNVKESIEISLGSNSLSNVNSIIVNSSTSSQTFGNAFASAIETANPGKTIQVIISEPTVQPTDPVSPSETVSVKLVRFTSSFGNEESFKIYEGFNTENDPVFVQPAIQSKKNYTWELNLQNNAIYAVELFNSYGSGWNKNSYLLVMVNNVVIKNITMLNEMYDMDAFYIGNPSNDLYIEEESDCVKLIENTTDWKSIYIAAGLCNYMVNDLHIENYAALEGIIIKHESAMNFN